MAIYSIASLIYVTILYACHVMDRKGGGEGNQDGNMLNQLIIIQCIWANYLWMFIAQVCEMKNCTKCIFFEMKKKKDLYMW